MDLLQRSLIICLLGCSMFVAQAGSATLYFWPMSDKTMAYELENEYDAKSPKKGECPPLAPGPALLGLNVFLFDGSAANYAEMGLKNTHVIDEFTISFQVYLEQISGVILDYEASSSKYATISGVTVEVINRRVHVHFRRETNAIFCSLQVTNQIPLRTWSVVLVSGSANDNLLVLQVDGSSAESDEGPIAPAASSDSDDDDNDGDEVDGDA